jgi:hypothetical protein
MAFLFDQFDVMEHLWGTLDKTPDGNHVKYTELDVESLWWMGFVDAVRFDMDTWKAAFEPYRQADDTFLLGRDDFFSLEKYRYKGEIHMPFDAMKINEGKYTDEGLDDLVRVSIVPSCSLPEAKLKEFFETLKRDFRQGDGLILVKAEAKARIKTLIENNPSPLRNLELLLNQMIESRGADIEGDIDRAALDAAAMQAAKQASSFSATPTTKTEAKALGLKNLTKARKAASAAVDDGKPKTELKNIRRSRKGMRG